MSRLDAIAGMLDGIERALDAGEYATLTALPGVPDDRLPSETTTDELEALSARLVAVQERLASAMSQVSEEIAAGPDRRRAAKAYISSGYHGS